ncbi:MAG: DUF11 domain-containing protein [Pirellulales bacterium]|nr:DUF11 domain-containing protein [Pirellulales bacterium]
MEVTITPVRRSLVRRVAPWALSLGLFTGGGAGLFRYVAQRQPDAQIAEKQSGVSSERVRQLFGDDEIRSAPRYDAGFAPAENRYVGAPVEATSAAAAPVNPFAAASYGDRYAAASASVGSTQSRTAEDTAPEVARGQNAGEDNPLRNRVAIPDSAFAEPSDEPDARNAFREPAPAATAPPAAAPVAAGRYASTPIDQQFANAFATPTPVEEPATEAPLVAEPPHDPAAAYGVESTAEPMNAFAAAPLATPTPTAGAYGSDDARSLSPTPREVTNPYLASAAPVSPPGDGRQDSPYGAVSGNPGLTPTPGIQTAEGTGRPGERGLEGAQTPTLAIQKLGPDEIQVGKKCTFAVRVKNVGQRAAHGVTIHDQIPQGTKLVGTAPRASVAGADVAWDLGTLSAGEERLVEMELIPAEEGELGSVATVTFAAHASARARCTRPQLALRLASQPRVMIGERHLVQVEVSNPGTGDATGVMLLENVPEAVIHDAGPSLEYEIGTLRAGESRTIELVLTAAQAGIVQNVMVARADANLEVQAGCEFEILAPDLKLSIEGPQMRYLERPAKYTVSVENPGTAAAHDVQLVSHLSKGLKFVSANNLGEYDAATHSIYWSLAELPANERGAVELVALPIEPGDHMIKTESKAARGLEAEAEARVRVEGLAALTINVSDLEDLIEVGGKTTYEIRVRNQGSKAATNVQVAAQLTPGMRVLTAEGETRHTVENDRIAFSPLPQLPPRGESIFRITVQAVSPGDQRLRVQVGSDDLQQPLTEEESTRVYADQ